MAHPVEQNKIITRGENSRNLDVVIVNLEIKLNLGTRLNLVFFFF